MTTEVENIVEGRVELTVNIIPAFVVSVIAVLTHHGFAGC
jgi:hypothetical protein